MPKIDILLNNHLLPAYYFINNKKRDKIDMHSIKIGNKTFYNVYKLVQKNYLYINL